MLAVPLRKTKDADLFRPLKIMIQRDQGVSFFKKVRGKDSTKEHDRALQVFNSLRDQMVSVLNSDEITSEKLQTLYGYYAQCEYAKRRFVGAPIRVHWYNAFLGGGGTRKASVDSLENLQISNGFDNEQQNVLYNIAAYEGLIGIYTDRSIPSGSKDSARHFSIAAGIFEYLAAQQESSTSNASTLADHQTETLRAFSQLMLACSQVCFYEKGVISKMSPKTLARLALGAKVQFEKCIEPMRSFVPYGKWIHKIQLQVLCFEGAAHYWQSHVEKEAALASGSKYGMEITRLKKAETLVIQAEALGKSHSLPNTLLSSCTALADKIQIVMQSAVEMNNSVYMDMIPSLHELAPIKPAVVAKITSFDSSCLLRGGKIAPEGILAVDLFQNIIPHEITKATVEYVQRVETIVNEIKEVVSTEGDLARASLASLGLPAAIDAESVGNDLPDSTWSKVSEVQSLGGISGIQEDIKLSGKTLQSIRQSISSIRKDLDVEESEDNTYRSQYGNRWTRVMSKSLTIPFRNEIKEYEVVLEKAAHADRKVEEKASSSMSQLVRLSASKAQLDREMPDADPDAIRASDSTKENLQALLIDLGNNIKEREEMCEKLKQMIQTTPVSLGGKEGSNECSSRVALQMSIQKALTKDGMHDDGHGMLVLSGKEKVFAKEMEPITSMKDAIHVGVTRQKKLLEEITSANDLFLKSKNKSSESSQRQEFCQSILSGCDKFHELKSNVRDGKEFYEGILNRCIALSQTVKDFLYTRSMETKELIASLAKGVQATPALAQPSPPPYEAPAQAVPVQNSSNIAPGLPAPPAYTLPPPSAPQSSAPQSQYEMALAQLRNMGFGDEQASMKALQQTGGKVEPAVEILLRG